jgi:hypothetical protein
VIAVTRVDSGDRGDTGKSGDSGNSDDSDDIIDSGECADQGGMATPVSQECVSSSCGVQRSNSPLKANQVPNVHRGSVRSLGLFYPRRLMCALLDEVKHILVKNLFVQV